MIQVATRPKTGQFVAVWVYNNQAWSNTYKWVGDELLVANDSGGNTWEPTTGYIMPGELYYVMEVQDDTAN